jgi:hypothetical protein
MVDVAKNSDLRSGAVDDNRVSTIKMGDDAIDLVDFQTGEFAKPDSLNAAAMGRIARMWQLVASLGGVWKWFGVDFALSHGTVRALGRGAHGHMVRQYTEDLKRTLTPFLDKASAEERKSMLQALGASHAVMNGHAFSRFVATDMGTSPATSKWLYKGENGFNTMAAALFKIQGADQLTRATESSVSMTNVWSIMQNVDKSFDELAGANPTLHRRMKEQGWSDEMWSRVAKSDYKKGQYIDIDKLEGADRQAATYLRSFLAREQRFAVATPDAYVRKMTTGKAAAGSFMGEAHRSLMQFQSFQLSFMRNAMARASREGGKANFLVFSVPLFSAAMMKVQMDAIVAGDPTFEVDSPVLWARAMDYSGLGWFFGTMASSLTEANITGHTPTAEDIVERHMGPLITTMLDAGTLGLSTVPEFFGDMPISGSDKRKMMDMFLRNLPFQNFWAVQSVFFDTFVDSWRDELDPMYNVRKERRLYERGQR